MHSARVFGLTISAILLVTLPLYSQAPAATFRDLQANPNLYQHDTVEITEANGTKYKAKLTSITDQTLTVTSLGTPRALSETQVLEIRHGRRDSLWNGSLIGLAGGVGAGLLFTNSCRQDDECLPAAALGIGVSAAGGAAVGAMMDTLTRKQETVFSRSSSTTMRIAPIVGKKVAGVHLSLRF